MDWVIVIMGLGIKISIITVSYNSENDLQKTIQSVIGQDYENKEYIIIDGNSTDNSKDVINKYKYFINKIVIENDEGIYNAMNKGIKFATGDYLYFLNCGDYFFNNTVLTDISDQINHNLISDIFYGDIIYYDRDQFIYVHSYRQNYIDILANGLNHQSMFIKRNLFKECGTFNEQYKIFSDFEWLLRVLSIFNKKIFYVKMPIAYYLKGGFSTQQSKKNYWNEKNTIIKQFSSRRILLQFALRYPKNFYGLIFY